jgi:hypothetical protein
MTTSQRQQRQTAMKRAFTPGTVAVSMMRTMFYPMSQVDVRIIGLLLALVVTNVRSAPVDFDPWCPKI